jgi:hypothetical protein
MCLYNRMSKTQPGIEMHIGKQRLIDEVLKPGVKNYLPLNSCKQGFWRRMHDC